MGADYVTPAVNGSLWTMKVEWCLYFSVPIFVWLAGRMRRLSPIWLVLSVIAVSIAYRQVFTWLYYSSGKEIYEILRRQIFGQLSFFYSGMLVYFIRDFVIKHSLPVLLLGTVVRLILTFTSEAVAIIFEPFAIAAIVMSLSLFPSDIKILRHRNNISYEMYLFHFPLIQLGIHLRLLEAGTIPMVTFSLVSTVLLALTVHVGFERWLATNKR